MIQTSNPTIARKDSTNATAALLTAAGVGVGAGLMFLFDPARGKGRRAKVRDKFRSVYNDVAFYGGKTRRDLANRASGFAAEAGSMLKREGYPGDQKLEARVRAKLGRLSAHPGAITVHAEDGVVTLDGDILRNEQAGVLAGVESVPGVREVRHNLHQHDEADVASLQGGRERPSERWEFMKDNWSPATRLLAGALGGGLTVYGLRSHGILARASAAAGAGLLARGLSNRPVGSWAHLR